MDHHRTTLASIGAEFVFSTFTVSAEEARKYAEAHVGLVDAKGGDAGAMSTAWFQELLIRDLGPRLPWRDPKQKAAWERERRDQYDALKQAMGVGRDPVFGKKF
jgi:hypothetical protein